MPRKTRLLVVMILLSAALTGMVMGARWTGRGPDSGAVVEPEKAAAPYTSVQAGVKEEPEEDSADSHNWPIYTGVSALTGLYITARIIGVRKRRKNNGLA